MRISRQRQCLPIDQPRADDVQFSSRCIVLLLDDLVRGFQDLVSVSRPDVFTKLDFLMAQIIHDRGIDWSIKNDLHLARIGSPGEDGLGCFGIVVSYFENLSLSPGTRSPVR